MAKFFIGGGLPRVNDVRDIYAHARGLRDSGVKIEPGEEEFLRQLTWCMLQLQHDQEESELHQALGALAGLVIAVIEDDDFSIPEGCKISTRVALEGLAVQMQREIEQQEMRIAAAIGIHQVEVNGADDLDALEKRLPRTTELERVLRGARIHLRQGEQLLAKQKDPERAAAHRERLAEAYDRVSRLLARLLSVTPERDHPVVRAHILRRELRRIEVDALGVVRLSEEVQTKRTRELLAWAEEDLGERLTDEGKAELADKLKAIASESIGDSEDAAGDWFFNEA